MKSEYILDAMTYIDDEYIKSALDKLDYLGKEGKQRAGWAVVFPILRKAAGFIVAAILVMSTAAATAMAFNEEFREAVKEVIYEFFHIEGEEVIPEWEHTEKITADNMYVEQDRSIIGGMIEGRYLHAPAASNAREGVFTICTDEIEMKQGSHYDAYYEENGEFVKLEEHTFSGDYTVLGNEFHISFEWAAHGGQVVLTYIGVDENYRIPSNPGDADAMMIQLQCSLPSEEGGMITTAYPVLLDLETGELQDVLSGTGAEELMNLSNQAISEDKSKMLLAQADGALYYVDLIGKHLYSVEEISGESADACSLIDDTLTCWVLEEDGYKAWTIDLITMERRELFCGIPNMMAEKASGAGIVALAGFDTAVHWGTMFTGSHFALITDEDRNVSIIDLVNGDKIPVEGLIWPTDKYEDVLWETSPDGKRLLISGGQIGDQYGYIGVLDFEKMSYLEFSRENSNKINEWKPYWFDRDTVIIPAAAKSGSLYVQDYYVYDILDETAIIIEGTVEKVPFEVFEGEDYCINVPKEGWLMDGDASWVSERNDKVRFWIVDYTGEGMETVCGQLEASGYEAVEETPDLFSYVDANMLVWDVKIFTEDEKVKGVFYRYPLEATEGFGTRLAKIVSTFEWNHCF